jgi:hypothetical protein
VIPGRCLSVVPRFGVNNVSMIFQAGWPGFQNGGLLSV